MRYLPLQDAPTVGERKPVVDWSEAPPGEQQMGERRNEQQESNRNENVSIREISL